MYKIDMVKCADCGYCAYVCPFGAIIHHVEEKYYEIDQSKCQHCGICFKSCIGGFIHKDKTDKPIVDIKINDSCIGCSLCSRVCPVSAIKGELRMKFEIDPNKCIKCGICSIKCPKKAIEVKRGK